MCQKYHFIENFNFYVYRLNIQRIYMWNTRFQLVYYNFLSKEILKSFVFCFFFCFPSISPTLQTYKKKDDFLILPKKKTKTKKIKRRTLRERWLRLRNDRFLSLSQTDHRPYSLLFLAVKSSSSIVQGKALRTSVLGFSFYFWNILAHNCSNYFLSQLSRNFRHKKIK